MQFKSNDGVNGKIQKSKILIKKNHFFAYWLFSFQPQENTKKKDVRNNLRRVAKNECAIVQGNMSYCKAQSL